MQNKITTTFLEALKTGDYTEIKQLLKSYEDHRIFIMNGEKCLLVANYFIGQNQLVDMDCFSKKEENDFERAICQYDLKKIQKLMAKYEKNKIFMQVKKGDLEAVKTFIEKTRKVNLKNSIGETLLEIAAFNGHVEVAELLIQKGAKLKNRAFGFGPKVYPLLFAIKGKQEKMVKLLLEKGACLFKEDNLPHPTTLATQQDDDLILSLILNEFQKRHSGDAQKEKAFWHQNYALHNAVYNGKVKMAKALLEANAPLYSDGTFVGYQMRYIQSTNKEMLDLLFEHSSPKERAMLFEQAVYENNTAWMYHLYQKKCPVLSDEAEYLKKENILLHAIYHKNWQALDEILKECSEEEKKTVQWDKVYQLAKNKGATVLKLIEKYDPNKKPNLNENQQEVPLKEPSITLATGTFCFSPTDIEILDESTPCLCLKIGLHKKNNNVSHSNNDKQKD